MKEESEFNISIEKNIVSYSTFDNKIDENNNCNNNNSYEITKNNNNNNADTDNANNNNNNNNSNNNNHKIKELISTLPYLSVMHDD